MLLKILILGTTPNLHKQIEELLQTYFSKKGSYEIFKVVWYQ